MIILPERTDVPLRLLDWQDRASETPEEDNLAILTGRGPGKSTMLRVFGIRSLAQHGADARVLLVRRTYKALAEHEEELDRLLRIVFGQVSYNRQEKIFRVPTGGTLELGQLEGAADYSKYQGRSFRLLLLDEIGEWPSLRYPRMLMSNLRGPAGVPLRTVIAGNPGGPGHVEVARTWVNGRRPWVPYTLDDGTEWITIAGISFDANPHVGDPDQYRRNLIASAGGDRALAAAWIAGDFSEIRGAFFGDLVGPHLVFPDDPEWKVPRGDDWLSYVSCDWGQSAPACAHLCAVPRRQGLRGPGGKVWPAQSRIVLEEVHSADPNDPSRGLNWPVSVLAEEILVACAKRNVRPQGCADDARGLGDETLCSEFRRFGLQVQRPNKSSRVAGWIRLKQFMASARDNDPDKAHLAINERCRYTLETLPALPRDRLRPEDCDSSANDHAADSLRYLLAYDPPICRVSRPAGAAIY